MEVMENSVSKSVLQYAGGAFLLAAAIAIVWQITGPSWFKNIKAEITNQPYARTVTVDGEGKISAKPDTANISFSVISRGVTVKEVTADNNQKMNTVLDAMKKLGIEDKDITTSQYSLYPQNADYVPGQTTVPKIIGYNLTQQVSVKIRKLENVDQAIDAATKSGVNGVDQLSFDIDDTGPVKKEARGIAFEKAHEKAQEMADAVGVKLGRVVTFSEGYSAGPQPYVNFAMDKSAGMAESSVAPSIQPGSKELNVTVTVTYELE